MNIIDFEHQVSKLSTMMETYAKDRTATNFYTLTNWLRWHVEELAEFMDSMVIDGKYKNLVKEWFDPFYGSPHRRFIGEELLINCHKFIADMESICDFDI